MPFMHLSMLTWRPGGEGGGSKAGNLNSSIFLVKCPTPGTSYLVKTPLHLRYQVHNCKMVYWKVSLATVKSAWTQEWWKKGEEGWVGGKPMSSVTLRSQKLFHIAKLNSSTHPGHMHSSGLQCSVAIIFLFWKQRNANKTKELMWINTIQAFKQFLVHVSPTPPSPETLKLQALRSDCKEK